MQTLFDPKAREQVLARIARLSPEARARWGRLTVDRMVVHLVDGLKVAFGESESEFQPGILSTRLGRWMVIDAPIPWPRGKVDAPEVFFRTDPSADFERDRDTLHDYVERFARGPEQVWGRSPLLGNLGPEQWARLNWRHIDHHLRQFGA